MSSRPTRRRVLYLAAAGITLGVAGCTANEPVESEPTAAGEPEHANDSHGTGHGHDGDHEHENATPAAETGPTDHATVTMSTIDDGDHFDPHVAWVEVGGTVQWEAESGVHTATAYHPDNDRPQRIPDDAEPFDTGFLSEEGATAGQTFEEEGVYDYYCTPHEESGMIGSVIVGRPNPREDEPGLTEPGEEFSETVREKLTSLNETAVSLLSDPTN